MAQPQVHHLLLLTLGSRLSKNFPQGKKSTSREYHLMNSQFWMKMLYLISAGTKNSSTDIVISGTCPADMALLEPGPVFHSRWLTLWERILRLYMCSSKPSYKLKRLVAVIVKFSAPMWFTIKCIPNIGDGAKHVFRAIKLLKNLTPTESKIARKTVFRSPGMGSVDNDG